MIQGRLRLRTATLLALVAALSVSGCTGASKAPDGTGSPATTATADPSPSVATTSPGPAPAPEAPRPPRARKGPAGQQAFAEFVMRAWSWSLRTNDAAPLLKAGPSREQRCEGCRALARELAGRAKAGWYVDFPGLTVRRTRLHRDPGNPDDVVAVSRVSIPESDSYHADGSYRSTSPAHADANFTVTMRWVRGAYRLVSFAVT